MPIEIVGFNFGRVYVISATQSIIKLGYVLFDFKAMLSIFKIIPGENTTKKEEKITSDANS